MAECFYFRAMRTRTGLHGNAKVLYLILAGHADQEGQCWPSIKTLAAEVETGERNIIILLHQLRAAGLLAVDEAGGGRGKSNRYRLSLPAVAPESSSESISEARQYTDPQITDLRAKPRSPDQRSAEPETLINPAETVIKRPETVIPGSPEHPVEDPREDPDRSATVLTLPRLPWIAGWTKYVGSSPSRGDIRAFNKQAAALLDHAPSEERWSEIFRIAFETPGIRKPLGYLWTVATTTVVEKPIVAPVDNAARLRDEQAERTQRGFDGAIPQRKYSGLDAPTVYPHIPAERPVRRLA
jgi:hypothetical protein